MPKGQRGIRGGLKPHLDDPYLARKSPKEPAVCPRCGLVYRRRRWEYNPGFQSGSKTGKHICPACRKIEDHYVMGIVLIRGGFFAQRREEIVNMMRNEERKGLLHNPLDRIMAIDEHDDWVQVETTSENLAVHLGRMLYHSYGGSVEYKFSDDQKLARVIWSRDKKEA